MAENGRDSASGSAGLVTAGTSEGSTGAAGPDGTSGPGGTDGGTSIGTTDDSVETGGNPPYSDVGNPGEDTGGEPQMGCQAVDFLFVIDNSVSMQNEQEALVGACARRRRTM